MTSCLLDGADTTSQLSSYASPVLVAVLNSTVCSKADGNEEEEGPDRSDDKTDWEKGQGNSWNDERRGRGDGGRCGCGRLRISIRWGGACSRENAIDKGRFSR
jgi:hypothetical protein